MSEGRIIPPGEVLPPMDTPADAPPRRGEADDAKPGNANRRKAGDRFALLNGFVDCSMADLSRAELATWLVLYRDSRDGTARTSADDIGRRIGTSTRRTLDALAKLRKRGLVTRVYQGGLNRGPSKYRVHPLPRGPT
jgi:hypothetical protein